jgi:hypothetical protein
MRTLVALVTLTPLCLAQKVSTPGLVEMARTRAPELEQAPQDTLGADNIQNGTAAAGEMGDFVFAVGNQL